MRFIISGILVALSIFSFGQEKGTVHNKNDLFFYWGYNRAAYTKSDFHISGEGYDLTFKDVRAKDKPTPFSFEDYAKFSNISKPQYNYRLGWYFKEKWSVSIGMDHLKYYMRENQYLQIEGSVSESASEKYAGEYDNTTHLVPWRFVWFHHSDGLNYTSIELEYNFKVYQSKDKKIAIEALANAGGGLVVPKTFVMVLNEGVDNKFHIAGGGPSVKLGARFSFFKYFYLEAAGKTGYVWMPKILVNNEKTAQAKQHFGWVEFYGALGFNIPLSGKQKSDAQKP